MARLMSVMLTEDAVRERRKTQTRRLGWLHAKVGDELELCRKVMGRKADEPLVRICRVRVTDVRREPLNHITTEEVALEGFDLPDDAGTGANAAWFVDFFCSAMRCTPTTEVTVITWEYLS